METYLIVGAIVIAAVLVLVALRSPAGSQLAPRRKPGRALIDHFEEAGKDAAGTIMEKKLGEYRASELSKMFSAAFGTAPEAPKA